MGGNNDIIIMTSETNPEVLAVCYAKGWCADANYMTKKEAEAVSNIGQVFMGKTDITHFEEFQYFINVTSLPYQAFKNCTNLGSIILPNTLTVLGNECFMGCKALDSIVIPPLVTSIPKACFAMCGISSISIPEGVTTIGNQAFSMNGTWSSERHLYSITYPSTVTTMGSEIHLYGVISIMTIKAIIPPSLSGNRMFTYGLTPDVIYVPEESIEAYKTAENWSTWANKYQAIPT